MLDKILHLISLCIININIPSMLNQIWFQDQIEGSIAKKEEKKLRIKPKVSFKIKNPTTLVKTNVQWAFKIAPKPIFKVILKARIHGSQKIKEQMLICNHGFQRLEKSNRYLSILYQSFHDSKVFEVFEITRTNGYQ